MKSMRMRALAMRRAAEKMINEPQPQLLDGVPSGTAMHRHYRCPRHAAERKAHVTGDLAKETGDGSSEGYPPGFGRCTR